MSDKQLENLALQLFLEWMPLPNGENAFDEKGNVKEHILANPGYAGVIDCLVKGENFVHLQPERSQFQYAVGYSEALRYKKTLGMEKDPKRDYAKKHRPKDQ